MLAGRLRVSGDSSARIWWRQVRQIGMTSAVGRRDGTPLLSLVGLRSHCRSRVGDLGGERPIRILLVVLADLGHRSVQTLVGEALDPWAAFLAVLNAAPLRHRHVVDEVSAGCLLVPAILRYDFAQLVMHDAVGDGIPAHHHWLVQRRIDEVGSLGRRVRGAV